MKYKYYLLALLAVALTAAGCYEDKGNYDYHEINDIVIDTVGFKMTYHIESFEDLVIDPVVTFSKRTIPEDDITYEWYVYEYDKTTTWKPVSEEKKLDIVAGYAPGKYKATIYVTDVKHKVTSSMTFDVVVNTKITHGYVILHGNGGEGDFDYIATPNSVPGIEEVIHLRNVLGAQSRKLPGNPLAIRQFGRNYARPAEVNSMFVSSDEDLFQVNYKNFQVMYDASDLFLGTPEIISAFTVVGDTRQLVSDGGLVYEIGTDRPAWDISIQSPIRPSEYIKGDVKIWKQNVIPSGYTYLYGAVFYDTAGKRFLGYSTNPKAFSPYPEQKDPEVQKKDENGAPMVDENGEPVMEIVPKLFDINNIEKDILLFGRGYSNVAYAVFKDPGQPNYWLYSMDFNVKSDATNVPKGIKPMSSLTEIAEAKYFALGTLGDVLIYASNRNIYSYDYAGSNTATKINPDFQAGEEITAMKIYVQTLLGSANERILYVATWNGTQGKLYEFGFDPGSGRLTSQTPLNTFEVSGKIVDMTNIMQFNSF